MTPVQLKEPGAYRPIGCASVRRNLSKTFLTHVIAEITTKDIYQFVHRSSISTVDTVAYFSNCIPSALDKKCRVITMLLFGYNNAFDSLDRSSLLNLLPEPGID